MQKSTIFLLIIALASAGVSAGLWMELRAERTLNLELGERLKVAEARPIAQQPVVNLPAEPPAVAVPAVAEVSRATAAMPAEPEVARPARPSPEHWQNRQRQLMSDPKYREAFREQQRLQLATRRDNFIRLLGFTPEQADAAIDLSIERQMNWSAGIPQEHAESEERTYQAKLKELLGDEKSAQLQAYMESRQSRYLVDRFRIQLAGNDLLRDDQVEPLIAALHAEQAQMQKDLQQYRDTSGSESDAMAAQRQFAERQIEAMKTSYKRMHAAASGILSSSQLARLDAMLKRDLERHEAQQRMARAQSKLEQPSVVEIPPR
jgi:hypothetical protein